MCFAKKVWIYPSLIKRPPTKSQERKAKMERQEKVIKGLESCSRCECTACPYALKGNNCANELAEETLEYFKEVTEANELLYKETVAQFDTIKSLKAENSRLENELAERSPKCLEEYKKYVERITLIKAEKALLGVFPKDADNVLFRNKIVKCTISRVIESLKK